MMPHTQYLRIESEAGGLYASTRTFVRACWKRLGVQGKSHAMRELRHNWIRDGLRQRQDQIDLMKHFQM